MPSFATTLPLDLHGPERLRETAPPARRTARAWNPLRALLCLMLPAALLLAAPASRAQGDAATEGARAFIQNLGDEAISFLADRSITQEQRATKFAELFHNKFAVESIARFVAGNAFRTATPAQQQEYVDLFSRFVVNTYAQRLSQYSGERLKVGRARQIDGDIMVNSEIVQPNGPSTKVDWQLRESDGNYLILDVVIEGISMAITQNSEFAAVIRQGGGGLDPLIAALKRSRFTKS